MFVKSHRFWKFIWRMRHSTVHCQIAMQQTKTEMHSLNGSFRYPYRNFCRHIYTINQHYRARLHTIITNKQYPPKSTQMIIIINDHTNLSHTCRTKNEQRNVGNEMEKRRNDNKKAQIVMCT